MKCEIFIDKNKDEEVQIFVHEKNALAEKIKELCENDGQEIFGKKDRMTYRINTSDVVCFFSENNKVFVMTDNEKYEIDKRLYELEEKCPDSFIRINQSCIANLDKIQSFGSTLSASLTVNFKNGYRDYVSRRQLKYVKERLMKK